MKPGYLLFRRSVVISAAVLCLPLSAGASAQLSTYSEVRDTGTGISFIKHDSQTSAAAQTLDASAPTGPFGHASASATYGSAAVDTGFFLPAYDYNHDYESACSATASWTDQYTIQPTDPSLVGHHGTMHVSFQLDGGINASPIPKNFGSNEATITVGGTKIADVGYDWYQPPDSNLSHYSTFTYDQGFSFGVPFDFGASIAGGLVQRNDAVVGTTDFTQNLTLSQAGFTVQDGSGDSVGYTATSRGGSAAGTNIDSGQSYTGFTLTNAAPESHETTLDILDGTASADTSLNAVFLPPPSDPTLDPASDSVNFSGTDTDKFVLGMTIDPTALMGELQNLVLAFKNAITGSWENAVSGNSDGGAQQQQILGAYDPITDFVLGNYGLDLTNNMVWAVIDHNSEYAAGVIIAPEPAAIGFLAGAVLALGLRRRRCREYA